LNPADLESLERATVEAVAPPEVLEIGGWLVPLDNGTIGRAKSAVPLSHDLGPETVGEIEAVYRQRGLNAAFRLADIPAFEPVRAELTRRGYSAQQSTIFKTGSISDLATFSEGSAEILGAPDEAWGAVFLGEGFDPADGAHRIAALTRSPDAVYGAAGGGGQTHAVGVMSFGRGWAGIHGMRTARDRRGQGLASRVLAALGRAAQARGVDRVFLQVEEANPARAIYRRAGFSPVWRYHYWR
jgi:GNAT superfamily N-acetyltransferase